MATTTWSSIREDIAKDFGFIKVDTTGSSIDGTVIYSTNLQAYFPQDDALNGWFVHIDAGTNQYEIRRIADYESSNGSITIFGTAFTDDSTARSISLFRYVHPQIYRDNFNDVLRDIFPYVAKTIDLKTISTGDFQREYTLPTKLKRIQQVELGSWPDAENYANNVLSNADFETWSNSTTCTSWSATNLTITQEEDTTSPNNYSVFAGSYSAKLQVAASTAGSLLQSVTPSVGVEGNEVHLGLWVYCNTADRVSAQISGSDVTSTPVTGTAHSGTGWELLEVSAFIDNNGTSFSAGLSVTSGTAIAFYADEAICIVGQSDPFTKYYAPIDWWEYIPPSEGASTGGSLVFTNSLRSFQGLRIKGLDQLTEASADTSTIEVGSEQLEPIIEKTKQYVAEQLATQATGDQKSRWMTDAERYREKYEVSINTGRGLYRPKKRLKLPM